MWNLNMKKLWRNKGKYEQDWNKDDSHFFLYQSIYTGYAWLKSVEPYVIMFREKKKKKLLGK